jgi:hypothetical protein
MRENNVTGLAAAKLSTGNAGGSQMLLQKSNGNFFIVLWNEPVLYNESTQTPITNKPSSVTADFGQTFTKSTFMTLSLAPAQSALLRAPAHRQSASPRIL